MNPAGPCLSNNTNNDARENLHLTLYLKFIPFSVRAFRSLGMLEGPIPCRFKISAALL